MFRTIYGSISVSAKRYSVRSRHTRSNLSQESILATPSWASTPFCNFFSSKHVLHKTSCLRFCIKFKYANGVELGTTLGMNISFTYAWAMNVPFRLISRSVRPPMQIPLHITNPTHLYFDLSCINMGLFRVSLSIRTKICGVSHSRLNRNLSEKGI